MDIQSHLKAYEAHKEQQQELTKRKWAESDALHRSNRDAILSWANSTLIPALARARSEISEMGYKCEVIEHREGELVVTKSPDKHLTGVELKFANEKDGIFSGSLAFTWSTERQVISVEQNPRINSQQLSKRHDVPLDKLSNERIETEVGELIAKAFPVPNKEKRS